MRIIKNILICTDKFKGTFTSLQAGRIIAKELKIKFRVQIIPLADGGDGTLEALNYSLDGKIYTAIVKDPLGRNIKAKYGIAGDTGIIEMAQSSGLSLLKENERNPVLASTYGLGQLIKKVLDKNVKKIYIGLGGSATNDAGAGMLQALGVKFLDKNKDEILDLTNDGFGAYVLNEVKYFDSSGIDKRIFDTEIIILSDVKNKLTGKNGTSLNYSYQKGADKNTALTLERYMKNFKKVIKKQYGIEPDFPGSGAAGGIAASIYVFLNGSIRNGIEEIIKLLKIESAIKTADLVITGEGSIDNQTAYGKAPAGIAELAKRHGKPVIAITGKTGKNAEKVFDNGIDIIIKCFNKEKITDKELKAKADFQLKKAASGVITVIANLDKYKYKIISYGNSENLRNSSDPGKRFKSS